MSELEDAANLEDGGIEIKTMLRPVESALATCLGDRFAIRRGAVARGRQCCCVGVTHRHERA